MLRTLCFFVLFLSTVAFAQDARPRTPNDSKLMTPGRRDVPRILMVLTSHAELGTTGRRTGYYLSEAAHPYAMFVGHGYEVDFASPLGGRPPVDGADAADPVSETFLADRFVKRQLDTTVKTQAVDPARYVAVFFVGGHGAMWDFPDDPAIQSLTARIYESGGVVAAVCHGPAALVNVKLTDGTPLVRGKAVSCFTNDEESSINLTSVVPFLLESKLIEQGAIFEKGEPFKPKMVVSDRLVTGQNPASATDVAEQVLQILKSR